MTTELGNRFNKIVERIEIKNLVDSLDEINLTALIENRSIIVFSNGISEYGLKRTLALHLLDWDSYEWRRENNLLRKTERAVIEDNVEMMIEDMADAPITVVQDSLWNYHPIGKELFEKAMSADAVLEIERRQQFAINVLAAEIGNGAKAEELLETIKTLQRADLWDAGRVRCSEFENIGCLVHGLLTNEMFRLLALPTTPEDARLYFGDLMRLCFRPHELATGKGMGKDESA